MEDMNFQVLLRVNPDMTKNFPGKDVSLKMFSLIKETGSLVKREIKPYISF